MHRFTVHQIESGSDITRPTLAIVSPSARRALTNASVLVQGTARDRVGVARVEYSLNSRTNYLTANGTTNWSANITMVPGRNTVRVRSIDLAGNVSAVVARTYLYRPPAVQAVTSSDMSRGPEGGWKFGFEVQPGTTYVLQASTNLQDWTSGLEQPEYEHCDDYDAELHQPD